MDFPGQQGACESMLSQRINRKNKRLPSKIFSIDLPGEHGSCADLEDEIGQRVGCLVVSISLIHLSMDLPGQQSTCDPVLSWRMNVENRR